MIHQRILTVACLTIVCLAVATANAQITYIDAVEGGAGNTFATGGSLADTSWIAADTSSSADQDQWKKRAFSNNGTVFQGRHSIGDGDDMPELTTQITGLGDGTYDVWAYFWDASGTNTWTLSAGLTSGALTTYSFDGPGSNSVTDANTQSFTASVLATESDRIMYGVNLGSAVVSGGSSIDVFLDNTFGGDSATRTWYDGVGYQVETDPLTLEVNTDTGMLRIFNGSGGDVDIRYYEINSPSGSLDENTWISLDDQDFDEGVDLEHSWAEAGGSDSEILSENNLLSNSTIGDQASLNLGSGFDQVSGSVAGTTFTYALPNGTLVEGLVTTTSGFGDMNGDGTVDDLDVNPFVQALTDRAAYEAAYPGVDADIVGDMNGDSSFNLGDVADFKAAVAGSGTGSANAVPEPSAIVLLGLSLLGLFGRRRAGN